MNHKDWNQSQIKPRPQCFLTNSISHTHAMFRIKHTGVYKHFFVEWRNLNLLNSKANQWAIGGNLRDKTVNIN